MALWKSLGSLVRQTGQALDGVGAALQGRLAYRDTLSKHRTLLALGISNPSLGQDVFVAPSAAVIGDVTLGNGSSVWYGAVLRGDVNEIRIGSNTNVQDGAILHVAKHNAGGTSKPTVIGDNVTIGHGATVHAATVEDGSLIGMGAVLLDGVQVEKGAIVAAGALVLPGKRVPSGQVWAGSPAKFLRNMEEGEADFVLQSADNYAALGAVHAAENAKSFEQILVDKAKREDRQLRDPDYDSHLGLERNPITREIIHTASHT